MFRTGDGARFLPDGQLELVGRVAFMLKLRGYSIVPMAVENALREHPGIDAAVVTSAAPKAKVEKFEPRSALGTQLRSAAPTLAMLYDACIPPP
eukprot:8200980-Pyramimonas_sp.AAC.2